MATAPKTQRLEGNPLADPDHKESHPFSNPTPDTDLILLVEDRQLHVSKVVLSLASPVFERMFKAGFKEKESKEITLPDKKFSDMLEFLMCIYPLTYKPITRENLDAVLPLAHEYQVQPFVDRCEQFVLNRFQNEKAELRNPSTKELVHFLFLAEKYGLDKLCKVCIEMTKARNYSRGNSRCAMSALEEFKMLSLETKYEIIEKRMRLLEDGAYNVVENLYSRQRGIDVELHIKSLKTDCFSFVNC